MLKLDQQHKQQDLVGVHQHGEHQLGAQLELQVTVTLDPGNWSLDNFGQVLVATIFNGKTFTWDAGIKSKSSTEHL